MKDSLKKLVSHFPYRWQYELKKIYFARQMKTGTFITTEKEFSLLQKWVTSGDYVLDIGANIGHYTCRLSDIVGIDGRVFAFEPVIETFELLANNVARLKFSNVTLLNMAASCETGVLCMEMPMFKSGLKNYYEAHLSNKITSCRVFTFTVDSLQFPEKVSFVKIDAEGHELSVLKGMRNLIDRDNPALVVEDNSIEIENYLSEIGYTSEKISGSPNRIFIQD